MKKRIRTIVKEIKAFCKGFYSGLIFFCALILLISEPTDDNVFSLSFLLVKMAGFGLLGYFVVLSNKIEKNNENEE